VCDKLLFVLSHVHLDIFDEFLFIESCGLFSAWVILRNFTPFVLLFFATMKLTCHFFVNLSLIENGHFTTSPCN